MEDLFFTFSVIVIVVLQLAAIVMLQRVFANKNIRVMSQLLEQQNDRIEKTLLHAIDKGTVAAHEAYKEANSVNVKIEHLNEQLLEKKDK